MTDRIRIPDPVKEQAEEIKEEYDYGSLGEAVRRVFRDGGYDV